MKRLANINDESRRELRDMKHASSQKFTEDERLETILVLLAIGVLVWAALNIYFAWIP